MEPMATASPAVGRRPPRVPRKLSVRRDLLLVAGAEAPRPRWWDPSDKHAAGAYGDLTSGPQVLDGRLREAIQDSLTSTRKRRYCAYSAPSG